jgi:hypothetical protein
MQAAAKRQLRPDSLLKDIASFDARFRAALGDWRMIRPGSDLSGGSGSNRQLSGPDPVVRFSGSGVRGPMYFLATTRWSHQTWLMPVSGWDM